MDHKQGIQAFARALRVLVESAKLDNGKSYDLLAARIRARQADGIIQDAIGYIPEELETIPEGDAFKPIIHLDRIGKLPKNKPQLGT